MSSMTILRNADGEQLGYVVTRQKLNQDERDALAAIVVNHLTGLRPMGFEAIRAEVAEGIAQAIEARGRQSHDYLDRAELPANPRYAETIVLTIEQAASIARGYTQPAQTPGQDS